MPGQGGWQHRLSRRRLPWCTRQRAVHPQPGFRRGMDHADRGQPGRSLHRQQADQLHQHADRSRQDRLPRLLGHQLLQTRRAPAQQGAGLCRADQGPARCRLEGGAGHRRQPRFAGLDHADTAAAVWPDLRQGRNADCRPPEPATAEAGPEAQPAARVLQQHRPGRQQGRLDLRRQPRRTVRLQPGQSGGDGLSGRRLPAVDRAGRGRAAHRYHRLAAAPVVA